MLVKLDITEKTKLLLLILKIATSLCAGERCGQQN